MTREPQWAIEIRINAPVEKVWEATQDLTLIPKYHPDVRSVEFVSGATRRAVGIEYKCIVPEGRKGWCVERVIENIPNQKMSVAFPEDSWGLSKMFDDFLTELTFAPEVGGATRVRLEAFYVPKSLKVRVMNALVMRRMMRQRALLTLEGAKRLIESMK
jgi:uncharacterized protein YndB with AHSA1/START domain